MISDFGGLLLVLLFGAFVAAAWVGVWGIWRYVRWNLRNLKGFLLLLFLPLLTSCGWQTIEPGHVGIEVNMWGSDRGVQDLVLKTGRVTYNPITTTIFEYPTYTQTVKYDGDEVLNFNSKEGVVFTAPMSVSYALKADRVPAFYVKFRNDDLKQFTHGFFRNVVRSAINNVAEHYTAEEVYSTKKEEILQRALENINNEVNEYGIVVEQFGFLSAPTPPAQIIEAINAKTGAIQKAIQVENELREAQAQAQKLVAQAKGQAESLLTKARAEAEANQKVAASLTPLLIQKIALDKWNGVRPQVEGTGSGLILNLEKGR